MDKRLKVNEIYLSLQGEALDAGFPCSMVRLTGCPLRCRWCDTQYAFTEGEWMMLEDILERVRALGASRVEVTGGEPLAQKDCVFLLERLLAEGYRVLLETAGSHALEEVPRAVVKIMDIKCPASGESHRNRWENLGVLVPGQDQIKFVLLDRGDYLFAKECLQNHGLANRFAVHFSPVHGALPPKVLAQWILEDRLPVRLNLQLHKILWGEKIRGR